MTNTSFNNLPFVGQNNAIRMIKSILASTWDSLTFNIVGTYGAGKTTFLEYIKIQIETGEWPLISKDYGTPKVLIVSGKSFGKSKETFIKFLYENIKTSLNLENIPEDTLHYKNFPKQMQEISMNKQPLVIMIDDFVRIMENIEESEIISLNSLLIPGIHYVFVTDHRDLHEIDPEKYSASPFFHTSLKIPLLPLTIVLAKELIKSVAKNEANLFIQEHKDYRVDKEGYSLDSEDIDFIQKLAGGHPGLLVSLTRLYCFEKFTRQLSIDENIKLDQDFLHYILSQKILQDGSIKDYLFNILKTIYELNPEIQKILLNIAIQDRGRIIEFDYVNTLGVYRAKLVLLNLINEDLGQQENKIPADLIRFIILQNTIDKSFSGAEDKLFKLLRLYSPGLVSISQIEKELDDYLKELPGGTRKRFIASTISRLRKKIENSVNPAAFDIGNIRGEGFFIRTLVSLDVFYIHGSSAFLVSNS